MEKYYQQGDVIVMAATIPVGAKQVNKRPLAFGEITGHSHQIVEDVEMYEKDGILYLRALETVNLKHEEHRSLALPPGDYQVGIVQEYDPFKEEARNVRD